MEGVVLRRFRWDQADKAEGRNPKPESNPKPEGRNQQPVCRYARKRRVSRFRWSWRLYRRAAQVASKVHIDGSGDGGREADSLSLALHKCHGEKETGALDIETNHGVHLTDLDRFWDLVVRRCCAGSLLENNFKAFREVKPIDLETPHKRPPVTDGSPVAHSLPKN